MWRKGWTPAGADEATTLCNACGILCVPSPPPVAPPRGFPSQPPRFGLVFPRFRSADQKPPRAKPPRRFVSADRLGGALAAPPLTPSSPPPSRQVQARMVLQLVRHRVPQARGGRGGRADVDLLRLLRPVVPLRVRTSPRARRNTRPRSPPRRFASPRRFRSPPRREPRPRRRRRRTRPRPGRGPPPRAVRGRHVRVRVRFRVRFRVRVRVRRRARRRPFLASGQGRARPSEVSLPGLSRGGPPARRTSSARRRRDANVHGRRRARSPRSRRPPQTFPPRRQWTRRKFRDNRRRRRRRVPRAVRRRGGNDARVPARRGVVRVRSALRGDGDQTRAVRPPIRSKDPSARAAGRPRRRLRPRLRPRPRAIHHRRVRGRAPRRPLRSVRPARARGMDPRAASKFRLPRRRRGSRRRRRRRGGNAPPARALLPDDALARHLADGFDVDSPPELSPPRPPKAYFDIPGTRAGVGRTSASSLFIEEAAPSPVTPGGPLSGAFDPRRRGWVPAAAAAAAAAVGNIAATAAAAREHQQEHEQQHEQQHQHPRVSTAGAGGCTRGGMGSPTGLRLLRRAAVSGEAREAVDARVSPSSIFTAAKLSGGANANANASASANANPNTPHGRGDDPEREAPRAGAPVQPPPVSDGAEDEEEEDVLLFDADAWLTGRGRFGAGLLEEEEVAGWVGWSENAREVGAVDRGPGDAPTVEIRHPPERDERRGRGAVGWGERDEESETLGVRDRRGVERERGTTERSRVRIRSVRGRSCAPRLGDANPRRCC